MSTEFGSTNRTAAQAPALVHVHWGEVILIVLLALGLAWVWSGVWLLPYLGDLLTQSTTPTDMLERVMHSGENRIEMRISQSGLFPRDLCFLHS